MQCPVCHSGKSRRVQLIEIEPVIALWHEFFKMDIRPEFHGISQMELWRCSGCWISFFTPESLAGSARMYAELADRGGYYVTRKWEYEVALADLRGRDRILEIGSGSGNFMILAREEAGLSIEGLEQNREAIIEAVRRGLQVREATVEEIAKESPGIYDAVCSFQVFEHIAKPKEFLDACCALLKPGGLLIVGVPNQDSYVRHMVNPLDMPPHHMTRWTRQAFERLPAYFPLKLHRTAYEPLGDQTRLYVDTYARILRQGKLRFITHPWFYWRTVRLIDYFGFNKILRGQNIYACYVRI